MTCPRRTLVGRNMARSILFLSLAVLGAFAEEAEPLHCKWNDLACQAERGTLAPTAAQSPT